MKLYITIFSLTIFSFLTFLSRPLFAQETSDIVVSTPEIKVDTERIQANVRKALSVPPNWNVQIGNLRSSPFSHFYQGTIDFTMNMNRQTQDIFISTDSQYYLISALYNSNVDMDEVRRNLMNLKDSPSIGSSKAPVTIVEYFDLQCAPCQTAHQKIKNEKLIESYEGKVRIVYKNLPSIDAHPWAMPAAGACLCAYKQDKKNFFLLQDLFFERQKDITVQNFNDKVMEFAEKTGLNMKKFKECYEKQQTLDQIKADMIEAQKVGVRSTPSFLVNGRLVYGFPEIPIFKQIIEEFLPKNKP